MFGSEKGRVEQGEQGADYAGDFALGGEIEFAEQDDEAGVDLEFLISGVRGARHSGA